MGLNDKLAALLAWISYGLIVAFIVPILINQRLFLNTKNKVFIGFNEITKKITCIAILLLSLMVIAPSSPILLLLGFLFLSLAISINFKKIEWKVSSISFNINIFSISIASLLLTTYLPWWRRENTTSGVFNLPLSGFNLALTNYQIIIFLFLISAFYWMLGYKKIKNKKNNIIEVIAYIFIAAILIILSISFLFSTGRLTSVVDMSSWWHWASFAGPAIQLNSGMVLLKDLPIQYGFGPTFIISAFCSDNCWIGV